MKLLWMTDLHLGMVSNGTRRKFLQSLGAAEADVVVVGGDISEARNFASALGQISGAAGCSVYFVLGNHDYYGGSIAATRRAAEDLHDEYNLIEWLPLSGVVSLAPGVALVGHGCWGDCRVGDVERFVRLNDENHIMDLVGLNRQELASLLRELGKEAAEYLRRVILQALEAHDRVIVLTHVAPTRSSALHEGLPPDDHFAPRFVCQAAGDAILEVMADHPRQEALVLCGHSHGGGEVNLAPNVQAIAGRAVYGMPRVNGQFRL